MTDRILDYAIGPVGRSVLIATASNKTQRGFPGGDYVYPFTEDGESMLIEIPAADIFKSDFLVYLSPNNAMDETYERFDRGTLQFIRPEHAAFPADLPQKKTTEMHIRSREYFASEDSTQSQNEVQVTVMNGGDSSQYAHTPYMHLNDKLQEYGRELPRFQLGNPQGIKKPVIFRFVLDTNSPPPPPQRYLKPVPRCPSSGVAVKSDQWFDSVQILFNQLKPGSKILTINFRFVEHANDTGAQVVPMLFDVTDAAVQEAQCTTAFIRLRRARIPIPFKMMQN